MKEKLVRDKMPEICNSVGNTPMNYRIAENFEMPEFLLKKLKEEVNELEQEIINREFKPDSCEQAIYEIADILEVLDSIANQFGIDMKFVLAIKDTKRSVRGGFEKRVVWDGKK